MYGEGTEAYKKWQEETTMEFLESGFDEIEKRLDRLEKEERTDKEKESLRLLRGYLENNRERSGWCRDSIGWQCSVLYATATSGKNHLVSF